MSKNTPKGLKKAVKAKGKVAKKAIKGKVKFKKKDAPGDSFQPVNSLD